ncbi:MAG: CBS domain-containing protein [Pseudomonadota bacterium]
MRAPTNYAGPRREEEKESTMSQSPASSLSQGPATVKHILESKGNAIYSVSRDDSMNKAVELMSEKRIGALLVIDDNGRLEGILSERDIVRKLAEIPGHVLKQKVDALMTTRVQSCSPNHQLLEVLKVMTEGRFRHMPVMENDHLLGIITIGDVVHQRLGELEHEAIKMKQMIVG